MSAAELPGGGQQLSEADETLRLASRARFAARGRLWHWLTILSTAVYLCFYLGLEMGFGGFIHGYCTKHLLSSNEVATAASSCTHARMRPSSRGPFLCSCSRPATSTCRWEGLCMHACMHAA